MEVMTLDEAIKHAEEVVADKEIDIENQNPLFPNDIEECKKCAAEHRQLAEWLKELKQLREQTKWIPVSERLPKDEYVLISKKPTKISGSKWSVTIAIRTADPRSRKIQWRDSGFGVIQEDKVLAWMPLPEPYKV